MHDKQNCLHCTSATEILIHVDRVLRYPNNARGRQGLDLQMKYINSKTGQT